MQSVPMPPEPQWRVRLAAPRFPSLDTGKVVALLKSGWLTNGAEVRNFEAAFAAFQGAPHAVACHRVRQRCTSRYLHTALARATR